MIENSIFESVNVLPELTRSPRRTCESEFQKKPLKLPSNKRLVVYTGTLESYQGVDILIHAFRDVVSKNPDALLLVVGGTKAQVEAYSALAGKLRLMPHAIFTGRVAPSLARYYNNLASVLVSPRTKGTNTPLKIFEQLASGIPLVATRIYSHTQVLNGNLAILVEPDPSDMARGIDLALNSEEGSRRVAANARRFYEQNYARPVYEQKMRGLLQLLSSCAE